jgi:hypothetical protein
VKSLLRRRVGAMVPSISSPTHIHPSSLNGFRHSGKARRSDTPPSWCNRYGGDGWVPWCFVVAICNCTGIDIILYLLPGYLRRYSEPRRLSGCLDVGAQNPKVKLGVVSTRFLLPPSNRIKSFGLTYIKSLARISSLRTFWKNH